MGECCLEELTLICPGGEENDRCRRVLRQALEGQAVRVTGGPDGPLHDRRLLFAVSLDETGVNHAYYDLLAFLRTHPGCLSGSTTGILVDGVGDLYTKATARDLALAVCGAEGLLVGRPLVEATGSLRNFTVQAKNANCSLEEAYVLAVSDLARRVRTFMPPKQKRPKIAVLHASSHRTSNTWALWSRVREYLADCCDIRTEPGGAPSQLFTCKPRNSAKEFSHMVLTIPFRQVLEIFPDRIKLRNLFRTYELLNILSGRLLASYTQPFGMTDDGIESLRSQHLPG